MASFMVAFFEVVVLFVNFMAGNMLFFVDLFDYRFPVYFDENRFLDFFFEDNWFWSADMAAMAVIMFVEKEFTHLVTPPLLENVKPEISYVTVSFTNTAEVHVGTK
ncbi:hypothetical protein FHS19_002061 [Paenibacillus rhizosphaerae]|uniref:Uncharacterized protein n=1 Tax=Paenibacillus rhizosphaerae TaxID=297318 RepID=A0A839TRR7_9BACL|nr:hypothetical protein [Paenibacillus rhizosphaerae]MBB3127407.1 hypothetical protein [Paenibacillus rhizosphaerae]